MIAANFRKYAAALALQLPLPFGTALVWATKRPGSRVLRAIRAARAGAFKKAGRVKQPEARTVPDWVKAAKRAARELAKSLRAGQCQCFTEEKGYMPRPDGKRGMPRWGVTGFAYAR